MTQITIEVTEDEYTTAKEYGFDFTDRVVEAYEAKKKEEPQAEPIPRYEYVGAVDYKTKYLELTEKFLKMAENYNKLTDKYINKGEK